MISYGKRVPGSRAAKVLMLSQLFVVLPHPFP